MSLKSARIKKIQSKMKSLEKPQHFSRYKSMGIFSDAQWQVPPQTLIGSGRTHDLLVFLVSCKNEEDPNNDEGARMATTLKFDYSDVQG